MKQYACKFFPVGDILLSLIETPDYPEKTDLKPFMISPIELYKYSFFLIVYKNLLYYMYINLYIGRSILKKIRRLMRF